MGWVRTGDAVAPEPGELICVVGPTASGKTELAIRLAERFSGEIIGVDSIQVYKHFDLGSGKPTAEERARAKHHLIDLLDPLEPADAQRFAALATACIQEVQGRGRVPVLCGGTFLWMKAIVWGLAPSAGAHEALRAQHRALVEAHGRAALHAELTRVDEESARRLAPNDFVRVSRALEILHVTGRKASDLNREHAFQIPRYKAHFIGALRKSEEIDTRIRERTQKWLSAGWIDEVRNLCNGGYAQSRAMGSVGYKQVKALLDGQLPLTDLEDAIVRATRIYVRRQKTWLRDLPVDWLVD